MPAFATVEDLATYMQQDFSAADSATASQALDLATGAIKDYTRQTLEAVTDHAVKLRGTDSQLFELPERPVTAVTAVSVDAQTLTAPMGYTWPGLNWLERPLGWGGQNAVVGITYSHGYATIPAGIKGICLEAAARLMANPEGLRQESIGAYSVTHGGAGGDLIGILAEAERRELNRYRRRAWS